MKKLFLSTILFTLVGASGLAKDIKEADSKAPTLQQLYAANPFTLPADWFNSGIVTVRGRIEDYDAERLGFSSLESYAYDVTRNNNGTMLIDINPDGTFEKEFQLSYPMKLYFYHSASSANQDFFKIPFFARPGETIDITVRFNQQGQPECTYNSGSSHEVERWLKADLQLTKLGRRISECEGDFNKANQIAEQVWQEMLARIDSTSRTMHYTPMEMHLALGEMQSVFALSFMDYTGMIESKAAPFVQREDGNWTRIVEDSAAMTTLYDINNYKMLHRVDFDNPLLLVDNDYYFTLNRIHKAKIVRDAQSESLEDNYAMWRKLMGCQQNNLTAQLCALAEMENSFNFWRQCEEDIPTVMADTTMTKEARDSLVAELGMVSKHYPVFLASFTHPYIHQKAEQFYQEKMAQSALSSPLPEKPGIDIVRKIIAKYPGMYLVLDFWQMGCGGCIFGIQGSKQLRAELAKRDDVKLIFIAGERTAEGSENYHKFVDEWLSGEEVVCVNYTDFRRLMELFQFSAIPHYETITPDGRRVRDDYSISGFDHFELQLQNLKNKTTL